MLAAGGFHHGAPMAHAGGHHAEHRGADGGAPAPADDGGKAKAVDVTPPEVIENKGGFGGRGRSFRRGRLLGKVRAPRGLVERCWQCICQRCFDVGGVGACWLSCAPPTLAPVPSRRGRSQAPKRSRARGPA